MSVKTKVKGNLLTDFKQEKCVDSISNKKVSEEVTFSRIIHYVECEARNFDEFVSRRFMNKIIKELKAEYDRRYA